MYVKPSLVWTGVTWGHGQTAAETANRDACGLRPMLGTGTRRFPYVKDARASLDLLWP